MPSTFPSSVLSELISAVAALVFVSLFFRLTSGWHHLRRLYPAPPHPSLTFGRWRRLHLGWSHWFNLPSFIGAGPDGLFLRAFPLLAFVNRPVLIPWRCITASTVQSHFLYPVQLNFAGSPIAPLRLPEDLAACLAAVSDDQWPTARVA